METRKIKLGADHSNTLTSLANLASTYQKQGRWEEAEELQAKQLETCTRALGPRHPTTLLGMENVAFIWKSRGRRGDVIGLMKTCLALQQQILDVSHPYTQSVRLALRAWQGENE